MFALVLLCSGLLPAAPPLPSPAAADTRGGSDAEPESSGRSLEERTQREPMPGRLDPIWKRIWLFQEKAKDLMHAHSPADARWKLALFCHEHALKLPPQAFLASVHLDHQHSTASQRPGLKKVRGRWLTRAQIAAEEAETKAQKKADQHWRPLLERWRLWLRGKNTRARAEKALAKVTDPRAVPSLWRVFTRRPNEQSWAVRTLGQIDTPPASRALAALAVFGGTPDVRQAATELIGNRDPHDAVQFLIGLLRIPFRYEARAPGVDSPGGLSVDGQRFNVRRSYAALPVSTVPLLEGDVLGVDVSGRPIQSRLLFGQLDMLGAIEAPLYGIGPALPQQFNVRLPRNSPFKDLIVGRYDIPTGQMPEAATSPASVIGQQFINDVNVLDRANAAIRQTNTQIAAILNAVTGEDFEGSLAVWRKWWADQGGEPFLDASPYRKPTFHQNVSFTVVMLDRIPPISGFN